MNANIQTSEPVQVPIASENNDADGIEWAEPEPLQKTVERLDYPINSLPDAIRKAVVEVQGYVQAPLPLIATSAITTLAVAAQSLYDVARDSSLVGPTSLFAITIADSGERKSTVDRYFAQVIREFESNIKIEAAREISEFNAQHSSWEAQRNGIKAEIQKKAKDRKSTETLTERLVELETDEPQRPKRPKILYQDTTPEALIKSLANIWPSAGVFSDEGGAITGSHGMSKDNITKSLATYNQLWGGQSVEHTRITRDSVHATNPRLTIAVQIQKPAIDDFIERSGAMLRGTGFLARFLICCPESTQGTRLYQAPPDELKEVKAFGERITEILEMESTFDENGDLSPTVLPLSAEAKTAWVQFHDAIEEQLGQGKSLDDVKDAASKVAENAARIAALLHVFESNGDASVVGVESMQSGIHLAAWHLNESQRFFGEFALSKQQANVLEMDEWLVNKCIENSTTKIAKHDLSNKGPHALRKKEVLDPIIDQLTDQGRVLTGKVGKKIWIYVNPAILEKPEP